MNKTDFKKELKFYSAKPEKPAIFDIPQMNYLCFDGEGDPNYSPQFSLGVEALFGLSYTIKFEIKKNYQTDFVVMPLEGLWWCDNMELFAMDNKADWKWTLMIMQPEMVTDEVFRQSLEILKKKKNNINVEKLRFEAITEGLSAQILHIGPYSNEKPTIEKLHSYIAENGYALTGKHREIYLSDMRKTASEKLKTIIRQPIAKNQN